jgi:hypothetical protein
MGATPKPHQFQPGNRLGGRPLGSRNRLSEVALRMLGEDFAEHGPAVIKQVRETRPQTYLSIVASLLPRQLTVERTSELGELSDEEIAMLEEMLTAGRAKLIDGKAVAIEPDKLENK